jgi:hypothetical protein
LEYFRTISVFNQPIGLCRARFAKKLSRNPIAENKSPRLRDTGRGFILALVCTRRQFKPPRSYGVE